MHLTLTLGWRRSCALALALVCGPSAALAQVPAKDALTFPPSLEHGVLTDWLKRETDIPPGAVVAISPLAVVAIMQTKPMASPEGFEVSVRAETIDAGFSRQEGIASWNATMKLACADRTFSMGEVTAHTARNLKGETKPIQTALAGWNPVTLGTMQGQIWSARCGGDFKPPLAQPPMPATAPPPARPAPAPAPSVAPTSPAAKPPAPPAATPAVATPAKPAPAPSPAPTVTPTAPAAKPLAAPMPPVAAPPKPEPTPPPAATPKPTPAPSPPVAKPPPPTSAASSVKPAGPNRPSSAQILSAPSSEEAARALTRLKSRLGAEMSGLSTSVVTVQTDGKTRYRAIVAGFQTPGDAMRFCEKVTAAGGKCLARNDAGRAASEKPAP